MENTPPSSATAQLPRPLIVRATPTAVSVCDVKYCTLPPAAYTRPPRSTPTTASHGDPDGATAARGLAAGGFGIFTDVKRGPKPRPSMTPSFRSNDKTL